MAVEELIYLKKLVGKFERRQGIRIFNVIEDHAFKPEIEVTDEEKLIEVNGFLFSLKAEDAPVKVNFDRSITDEEYTVVFPSMIKKIARLTSKIYAMAPAGQIAKLTIEYLKLPS